MKKSELRCIIKEEIKNVLFEGLDLDLENAIRKNVCATADEDYLKWSEKAKFSKEKVPWEWDLQPGPKFVKLIHDEGGRRSVWGFVAQGDGEHKGIPHKKGDVFKAASFNAPAKHKRGNAFVKQNWKWTGPDYL